MSTPLPPMDEQAAALARRRRVAVAALARRRRVAVAARDPRDPRGAGVVEFGFTWLIGWFAPVCDECGAWAAEAQMEKHRDWHLALKEAIANAGH